MDSSKNIFGQLLTEGLYRIKLQEGKPLSVIQDELGYAIGRDAGGSPLAYWRRGNVPTNIQEFVNLLQHMVRRGNINREWIERLVSQTEYSVEAICDAVSFNGEPSLARKSAVASMPGKDYRRFVGRKRLIEEIVTRLGPSERASIVSIDGQGGIGKSALALDVATICQNKGMFDQYVWLTAAGNPTEQRFSIENLLNVVGFELEGEAFVNRTFEERKRICLDFFTNTRSLVVLDNLETAVQPQHEIIQQLHSLLGNSKAIVTSRHRVRHHTYPIHLTGLAEEEAIDLIHQCGQDKGIHSIETLSREEANAIILTTGGSPLAIQLVVSHLHHLPLPVVLKSLSEITPLSQISDEGEYVKFYKHVFHHSWRLLDKGSKSVLVTMAQFVPTNGAQFEAIQHISELEFGTLLGCIETLWDSSLLEIRTSSGLSQLRYYLHPLTHNFVLSDIAKVI